MPWIHAATRLLCLGALTLLAACATPPPPTLQLQILAINDFHGHLLPPPDLRLAGQERAVPVGGAEALASAVKRLRAGNPHHVFVAAGDLIGGTPLLSALFRDEPTLESLSAMGLHLSAVGNHEFDLGRQELLRRQQGGCHPSEGCKGPRPFAGAGFQYLAASTVDERTGAPLLPPYAIRRFEGVPVGFIGLTLKGTPNLVMPSGIAGLRFEDEVSTITRYTAELQAQGVQAIVVLIHEGAYPGVGEAQCPGLAGPVLDIVQRSPQAVDLFVTGHTHSAYNCVVAGRRVTSADRFGSMVSDIRLTLDRRSGDVIASSARNVVTAHSEFGGDEAQRALLAGYLERARPLRERVVAQQAEDVLSRADARTGASPLGQLIADAYWHATRGSDDGAADLALMNSCGVRGEGLRRASDGQLRYEQLFAAQPFGNQLVTLTLSGAELLALLQRQFRDDHGCNRVQVSASLRYSWDARRARDARVVPESIFIQGEPLQLMRDYRVTVNNFMHEGGDRFSELPGARAPRTGPLDLDALEAHVLRLGTLRPAALDRITRLD